MPLITAILHSPYGAGFLTGGVLFIQCSYENIRIHICDFTKYCFNHWGYSLIEAEFELRIEPGRSLLNQTGMTIAKVAHRKKDAKGQWLIGLEMNMSQMMSSSTDFLLDPYVLYAKPSDLQIWWKFFIQVPIV